MDLERTLPPNPYDYLPRRPGFELTSQDITDGAPLDLRHVHVSAGGGDRSPQLVWRGYPGATRSFAVSCFDPDAPTLSGWWHWYVVNLPVQITRLESGAGAEDESGLPQGAVQLRNDYGRSGFGGAAPPAGDPAHRYFFVVHALDVDRLHLGPQTTPAMASFFVTSHTLARAAIVATYQH